MSNIDIDDNWEAHEAKENQLWSEFHMTYTTKQIENEMFRLNLDMPEEDEYTYEEVEMLMFDDYCAGRD